MDKLPTKTIIDKMLRGGLEKNTITNIYGPAGSGKTNIILMSVLSALRLFKNKVIYVDTEGSFSLERFKQLGGTEEDLKKIIFIEVHEWKDQHEKILSIEKIIDTKDVSLIAVDSIVALYRIELEDDNYQKVNKQLATQYSILSKISRNHNIPVIVTNQVYGSGDKVELSSRSISKYWSKVLVELKRTDRHNRRIAILRKHRSIPEGKKIEFELTEKGMKEIKFGIF
ncbi:DNA repair and recombination protein RadB [Candidatus Aenigmatarchaeota archaeon]